MTGNLTQARDLLRIIARTKCEKVTSGSRCWEDPTLTPDCPWSADRWCDACTAQSALDALETDRPDGYVVLAKHPRRGNPDGFEYTTAGSIWPEREPVDNHRGWCEDQAAAKPERFTGAYVVAEVRVVES